MILACQSIQEDWLSVSMPPSTPKSDVIIFEGIGSWEEALGTDFPENLIIEKDNSKEEK
jgi:hypothetical protein